MENLTGVLVLIGFFIFFAAMVYWMVNSRRKDSEKKLQVARSFGFSPVKPDAAFTEKVSQVYRGGASQARHISLRNVSRKAILDGECYLLDIVVHTDEESETAETQAVAIFSPSLRLPRFGMFPRPGLDGTAAILATKAMNWVVAKQAPILEFPGHAEFEKYYVVGTHEPVAVREFFTPGLLDYLGGTRGSSIRAARDGFICSIIEPQAKLVDPQRMGRQVQQGLDVFDAFMRFGGKA